MKHLNMIFYKRIFNLFWLKPSLYLLLIIIIIKIWNIYNYYRFYFLLHNVKKSNLSMYL